MSACKCYTCYPSGADLVNVCVSAERMYDECIIRNGVFKCFEDAVICVSLVRKQQNPSLSHVTKGNEYTNTKRVICPKCRKQLTFTFCKVKPVPIRLFDCRSLKDFLDHPCTGNPDWKPSPAVEGR